MSNPRYVGRSDLATFATVLQVEYPDQGSYCTPEVVQQLWEMLTERLPHYARQCGWPLARMYTAGTDVLWCELTLQNAYLRVEGWKFDQSWLADLPTDDNTAWDFSLFYHQAAPWYLLKAWVFYLGQS